MTALSAPAANPVKPWLPPLFEQAATEDPMSIIALTTLDTPELLGLNPAASDWTIRDVHDAKIPEATIARVVQRALEEKLVPLATKLNALSHLGSFAQILDPARHIVVSYAPSLGMLTPFENLKPEEKAAILEEASQETNSTFRRDANSWISQYPENVPDTWFPEEQSLARLCNQAIQEHLWNILEVLIRCPRLPLHLMQTAMGLVLPRACEKKRGHIFTQVLQSPHFGQMSVESLESTLKTGVRYSRTPFLRQIVDCPRFREISEQVLKEALQVKSPVLAEMIQKRPDFQTMHFSVKDLVRQNLKPLHQQQAKRQELS